jgi:hypothetical protein
LQNARLLARNANLEAEKTELMELSNALQFEVEDCRSSQVGHPAGACLSVAL